MTLPDSAPLSVSEPPHSDPADPFGLWQAPKAPTGSPVSFGRLGSSAEELPAAVWSLDLTAVGLQAGVYPQLAQREQQVQAIEQGLEQAAQRLDALLSAREAARLHLQSGSHSFAVGAGGSQPKLPAPELSLSQALDQLEPAGQAVSFGLREDFSNLAGKNWGELRAQVERLFDSINQQLLHFVWVDSYLDEFLAARTVLTWSGDLATCCRPNLNPSQAAAHQRSLELALASRSANLKTIITVSQMATKIAVAVTTPLGPIQALALAWDFVNSIVLPMVRRPS